MPRGGWTQRGNAVGCGVVGGGRCGTHPCDSNERTPDEPMLALFPNGHAEGGVGGEPVDTNEDVRRGEVEAERCQGRSRTRICGHRETGRIWIFVFGIFFVLTGSERKKPMERDLRCSSINSPPPPPECPPLYNPHPSPSSSPSTASPPPLIPPRPPSSSAMLSTSNPSPPLTPRPILKRTPSSMARERKQAVVHFPPSPIISKTFVAHSPSTYDRSPIVVVPNSCALPERGCPGRTYTLDRNGRRTNEFGGLSTLFGDESTDSLLPPPLMPDTSSSSSDESSDGLAPLPPPFNSLDSKHRKRSVRRHHKQLSTPLDHSDRNQVAPQYSRSSFSDSSLRSNLLADEGCFGGF